MEMDFQVLKIAMTVTREPIRVLLNYVMETSDPVTPALTGRAMVSMSDA
jgi:hypothetical protein